MEPEPPSIIARLSFISPKLIAEIAPSEYFTLSTGFWLKTSFWDYDESGQSVSTPMISPSFTFEPRFYFNLEDRQEKDKRTRYYSGWYWNISIGPGFTYADSHYYWSGAGDLGLGIILNKM